MEKEKVVVILSGGMDSTTLLYDVINQGYDVFALSFDYNQKHKKELKFAKKTCEILKIPHKVLNLKILNEVAPSALTRDDWEVPEGHYEGENMKQTVVKNRNMVLLSLAGSYAMGIKAKRLFYGAHGGDHEIYPDCRKEFVEKMAECIELADWDKVILEAPYLDKDKGDIVTRGIKLNVPYKNSWTCYKGKKKACGRCGSCSERILAFHKNNIRDPIHYEDGWDKSLQFTLNMLKKERD